MRCALATILLAAGCSSSPSPAKGLSSEDQRRLEGLLRSPTDQRFDEMLEQIAGSGDPGSILLLTHAMIQLPWVKELDPHGRGDLRMRKVRVEQALDHLVASPEHEQLSARYFRAATGDGPVDEAAHALIQWTLDPKQKFVWSPEDKRFSVKP